MADQIKEGEAQSLHGMSIIGTFLHDHFAISTFHDPYYPYVLQTIVYSYACLNFLKISSLGVWDDDKFPLCGIGWSSFSNSCRSRSSFFFFSLLVSRFVLFFDFLPSWGEGVVPPGFPSLFPSYHTCSSLFLALRTLHCFSWGVGTIFGFCFSSSSFF